jgi:PAT family beta-lactamase induction signal transducer AmpG
VPLRTQLSAARYGLVHQLASVFVLIILLVSVPASFTQMFNTDWPACCSAMPPLDLLLEDRAFLRLILYTADLGVPVDLGRRGLAQC